MKKRLGFTLSEILLAVGILGLLIALVTPAIVKVSPSTDKMIVRQTYYTATMTVSELINNSFFYKRVDDSTGVLYEGFDDTSEITYRGTKYSGQSKFIDLFIHHLNIKGTVQTGSSNCSGIFSGINICKAVYTTTGPKWIFGVPNNTSEITTHILVDTNGDKGPNCRVGSSEEICQDADVVYDQYRIVIYNDGKIKINNADTWAAETVKSTGTLVD